MTNKVVYLAIEVKGTLEELRELFLQGAKTEARRTAKSAGKKAVKATTKRAKSAWQRYISTKKNQIKFKRGPKKGLLDMKAMSRAFKRGKK